MPWRRSWQAASCCSHRQLRASAGGRSARLEATGGRARPDGARHRAGATAAAGRAGAPRPAPPPTDAEALFVRRAGQVRPDLALANGKLEAVAEICRRLDGLPLAIELAAARVRALSPPMLLERLDERLPLLTGGPATPPSANAPCAPRSSGATSCCPRRNATCSPASRSSQAAAPWKRRRPSPTPTSTRWPASSSRTSFARTTNRRRPLRDARDHPRYAAERLRESGTEADLGRRHADFFVALAEEAERGIYGRRRASSCRWTASTGELPNIRSALASLQSSGGRLPGASLVHAIWTFWEARRPSDGRRWLRRGCGRRNPSRQRFALAGSLPRALDALRRRVCPCA